jgi:hypothetical protein
MIVTVLVLLCLIDAGFSGWRAMAGRSGLLDKRALFRRGVALGAIGGLFSVVAAAICAALLRVSLVPAPPFLLAPATLFVVYAVLACLAMLLRIVPIVDLRSLISILVLAPLLILRWPVLAAGVALALWSAPEAADVLPIVVACGLNSAIEPALSRWIAPGLAARLTRTTR